MRVSSGRICGAFSHASALGFAILDDQLRYRTLNHALAAIHGLPAAAHSGRTIRDILGNDLADQIEPLVKRFVVTGTPLDFETNLSLPSRSEPRSVLKHYFAISPPAGKTNRIGVVVVEVTQQRKLDAFMSQLACALPRKETKDNLWLARELHDSINQYHFALRMSIGQLTRTQEKGPELLAQGVELLDRRILALDKLLSAVTTRLPIDQQS